MGYFQVRYDSSVINYDHRAFIRLTTVVWIKMRPNSPIPNKDACNRYCLEMVHWWLFDMATKPKASVPMEAARPRMD